MKRMLLILLLFSLLLTGCTSALPTTEKREDPPSKSTLMESRKALGEDGNIWYIPNETIENTFAPTIHPLEDNLLIESYSSSYDENGKSVIFYLDLKSVSLTDGSVLALEKYPTGRNTKVQTSGNRVSFIDPSIGSVTILDDKLKETAQYQVDSSDSSYWYLSTDQKTLFCLDLDSGISSIDLASDTRTDLISPAMQISICGESSHYVIFSYIDGQSQKNCNACLNLDSGTIEPTPLTGELSTGCSRNDKAWVLSGFADLNSYLIHTPESDQQTSREEKELFCLSPQNHLLATNLSWRKLNLYDVNGNFISGCSLPEDEMSYAQANLIWSDYWNGYFFTDMIGNDVKLIFWDISAEVSGSDLPLEPKQNDSVSAGTSTDADLYTKARELSEQFGVDIRIADQCRLDYEDYTADAENNPEKISNALDMLEETMAVYPTGFFSQLTYGEVRTLRIELVKDLVPTGEFLPSAAFTQEQSDYNIIVLDTPSVSAWNFHHEISHVIDNRLSWDSVLRPESLYNEESWLALQPEGFDYAYSYTDIPSHTSDYADSGYFVMDYAMTYPTEDRATVFEAATNEDYTFEKGSPLWTKLDFYCRCIRDCFDTDGWPAVTVWEQDL